MKIHPRAASVAVALTATVLATVGAAHPALGTGSPTVAQPTTPSPAPSAASPQVVDGQVQAFADVGSTILAGGTFTRVQNPGSSAVLTRNRIVAFDERTGVVSTSFAPNLNDDVYAMIAGPTPGTVYVAGLFTTLNGSPVSKVVLLNTSNGSQVKTFNAGTIPGRVDALRLVNGQLVIGGTFSKVAGTNRGRIASLDPTTGALTSYVSANLTGHHNIGHAAPPTFPPGATLQSMPTSALALDVNPQGTKMVVVGNFDTAGGLPRDQIAMFDLTPAAATVSAGWNTTRFGSDCFSFKFDEWIRDVSFAPDGSYFAVATAGGHDVDKPISSVLCDTVSRWNTADTGQDVQPAWVSYSGSDSFLSVLATGSAIYGGGHPRWMNNVLGNDGAGPGAVARPSLTALDPVSGMPLAFNPGREPRGHGIEAMLATPTGLWTGSDTDYVGPRKQYTRKKIAFFPLAGAPALAATTTATLPATVHLGAPQGGGATTVSHRVFTGTTSGPPSSTTAPFSWSGVRGAVVIGSTLFYGRSDQMLYQRSFDGTSFGPEVAVNPYSTAWDTQTFGCVICNGGNTYAGIKPDFYAELPTVTAMAFDPATRRLYYTRSGSGSLFYRPFSPDSGVVYPVATTVPGSVDLTGTTGLVLSGTSLYVANGATGNLSRVTLSAGRLSGTPAVVSGPGVDGVDWRAAALFTGP